MEKKPYADPRIKELEISSRITLLSGSGTGDDWGDGGDE